MLKRPEFDRCFSQGRKLYTRHFVVFALPRESHEPWRVGLTVSRKFGSSPQRNRLKRVLREFFRLNQDMHARPYDVVIVPKRSLDPERVDLKMVSEDLAPLIRRLPPIAPGTPRMAHSG